MTKEYALEYNKKVISKNSFSGKKITLSEFSHLYHETLCRIGECPFTDDWLSNEDCLCVNLEPGYNALEYTKLKKLLYKELVLDFYKYLGTKNLANNEEPFNLSECFSEDSEDFNDLFTDYAFNSEFRVLIFNTTWFRLMSINYDRIGYILPNY